MRVFESRVTGKIFRPERNEVTGDWRRLHSDELNDVYSSQNIIRFIKPRRRWTGNVACTGGRRGAYRILVGKSERKRPL